MTVYACRRCRQNDRITSISMVGSVHYDEGTSDRDACSGCPQCAGNYCASCANELEALCPCGGELVYGMMYRFNGDDRLPPEIAELRDTSLRYEALDRMRATRHMIVAEYEHFRRLIASCERIAVEQKCPLPDNPGLSIYRSHARKWGLAPVEAWDLFYSYAVPSNVDEMVQLLDEYCLEAVVRYLSNYPINQIGWQEREREYEDPKYHSPNFVPYRTAAEMCRQQREFIELLRSALEKHLSRE